jgi:hypothetical protein
MIIDTSAEPEPKIRTTRTFRKYEPTVRFSPEQNRRQNDLLREAWGRLESKDAVMAFLLTDNQELGGQPLALAMASEDGLKSAVKLLGDMRNGSRRQRGV